MRLSVLSSPAPKTCSRGGLQGLLAAAVALLLFAAAPAASAERIQVAYAGSMGVVMDRSLGPAFARDQSVTYEGLGQGAYGLARLIASHQIRPDVFISITPGPMKILMKEGFVHTAYPIASTEMVIAYNPRGRFAEQLAAAASGKGPWYEVLTLPGFRFGRTDPAVDPQGRNIIFTLLLAERYYHLPDLAQQVLGPFENPAQIFSEGSLLSRLEAGQLDAASGYRSAVLSHGLPFISLPAEINLSDARLADSWYDGARFTLELPDGRREAEHSEPLVFYAAALQNTAHPSLAAAFVEFLRSPAAAEMLRSHGYGEPKGTALQ